MFWLYSIFSAGYRHPSSTTVARTVRILHTLLGLVGKHRNCDKFEVNTQSVAYLAGEGKENKPSYNNHNNFCPVFHVSLCICLLQLCSRCQRRCAAAAVSSTGSLCFFQTLPWRTSLWTLTQFITLSRDAGEIVKSLCKAVSLFTLLMLYHFKQD